MELLSRVVSNLERNTFYDINNNIDNKKAINQELVDDIAGDIKDILKKHNNINFVELIFAIERASESVAAEVITNSRVI